MKIETGIAVPEVVTFRGYKHRTSKYPFAEMVAGDSAFFPDQGNNGPARSCAEKARARNGFNYVSRIENGGIRIWRVD